MWRSLFIAIGICCCVVGVECLVIEKAVLAGREEQSATFGVPKVSRSREVVPPDWAAWSFLSTGAVTMLYSFTLPGRLGKSGH